MSEEQGSAPGTGQVNWIRMVRRLEAPPERAFRAWSDPEEMQRWLPERIEGSLAAGTRSVLVWREERVPVDVGEVQAHSSFTYRRAWSSAGEVVTTTRLTFVPVGYGSRVEVEDGPFDLDLPGGLEAWGKAVEWWAVTLTTLRAHLDFSVDLRYSR
jgi:uncharacterized protein YndB with AHSA1/START domain